MRRLLSVLMVVFMLAAGVLQANAVVIGDDVVGTIVHDKEKNDRIDELFALRNRLETDYEANEVQINQIDRELELLGVETLSHAEAQNKLGADVLPMVTVGSTSTTRWTSRRVVVTYNGQQYELQIIEGVPISGSSPLRKNYTNVDYEAAGVVAGTTNVIKVLGAEAAGSAAVVGSYLAAGVSTLTLLQDVNHAIEDALSTSTVIDDVTGVAVVSLSVHMKCIFVKPYQTSDYGNQARCYIGSSATYTVSTVSVMDVVVNGELHTYHDVSTGVSDTTTSAYYNDLTLPARNYYNYKYNGVTNYPENYRVTNVKIRIFGTDRWYAVPSEMPAITG